MTPIHIKLKHLRLKYQLTQVQVAERLNCSIPAYSKMETGSTDVNTFRLHQLAKIYNIEVFEIFLIGEDYRENYKDKIAGLSAELSKKSVEILQLQRKLIKFYEDSHYARLA
ncbi:MAG: family transcriptional regulator [Pedobacter sp.]|jgi:transcriptional regulator with XRE-family HTH domain|nr:family transcriptional regulator [Pedobacter sp.]